MLQKAVRFNVQVPASVYQFAEEHDLLECDCAFRLTTKKTEIIFRNKTARLNPMICGGFDVTYDADTITLRWKSRVTKTRGIVPAMAVIEDDDDMPPPLIVDDKEEDDGARKLYHLLFHKDLTREQKEAIAQTLGTSADYIFGFLAKRVADETEERIKLVLEALNKKK